MNKKTMTSNNRRNVLLLTQREDEHADVVAHELRRRNVNVLRFDQADYPETVSLSTTFGGDGGKVDPPEGFITYQGTRFAFSAISAVWQRRPTVYRVPDDRSLTDGEKIFIETEARVGIEGIVDSQFFCVSASHALRTANNKPLQLQRAQEFGFTIPRTLLTNEPATVLAFYEQCHEKMITKAVKSGLVKDDQDNSRVLFTHRVKSEHLRSSVFQQVRTTTHLFQEQIVKAFDLRIVVIGQHLFAAELHTPAEQVDFRSAYEAVTYRTHQLPEELSLQIFALVRSFGLQFSSMDMIVTPEGNYVWIELNPNGQFYWLQYQLEHAGAAFPLIETMANLLVHPEVHAL